MVLARRPSFATILLGLVRSELSASMKAPSITIVLALCSALRRSFTSSVLARSAVARCSLAFLASDVLSLLAHLLCERRDAR